MTNPTPETPPVPRPEVVACEKCRDTGWAPHEIGGSVVCDACKSPANVISPFGVANLRGLFAPPGAEP